MYIRAWYIFGTSLVDTYTDPNKFPWNPLTVSSVVGSIPVIATRKKPLKKATRHLKTSEDQGAPFFWAYFGYPHLRARISHPTCVDILRPPIRRNESPMSFLNIHFLATKTGKRFLGGYRHGKPPKNYQCLAVKPNVWPFFNASNIQKANSQSLSFDHL